MDKLCKIIRASQAVAQARIIFNAQHLMKRWIAHVAIDQQDLLSCTRQHRRQSKGRSTLPFIGARTGKQKRPWDTMVGQERQAGSYGEIGFPSHWFFVGKARQYIFFFEIRNWSQRCNSQLGFEISRVLYRLINLLHYEYIGGRQAEAGKYRQRYIEQ